MNLENEKIAITVDDWDALRADSEKFAVLKALIGGSAAIILSHATTNALSIAMRDFCPRTYIADRRILSPRRLARLCGRVFHFDGAALQPLDIAFTETPAAPRFGFIVSNGIGLGHVTRTQAIQAGLAPYGPGHVMSFSAGLVGNAFHLASPHYLECDKMDGFSYVREAARRFLICADPTHVFYDGNNIPPGVLAALADRPHIHLTWVRRGMWLPGTSAQLMAGQALADLVIEPGELSEAYDTGPSWSERNTYCPPRAFLKTLPIRPQDPGLLTREQVMAEFGFDLRRKHALLMPSATQKPEDAAVLARAVEQVRKAGYVPIVAHWPISHDHPPQLPGALTIERMSIARYYGAFDVIISSAGYNSFHELLAGGYPVVFLPREDDNGDQQLARARYAADHGLAHICRRGEIERLHEIIPLAKPGKLNVQWLNDFSVIADALGLKKEAQKPLKTRRIAPNPKTLKAEYRGWKRGKGKLFENTFLLALDMSPERFLRKSAAWPRDRTIVVTDSVDPVALRRAGFRYLWINGGMLSGFGLTRQFLNWLSIWKPKKIRNLNARFG